MTQDTIDNDMARPITPPPISETVSKLKLYKADHELAIKIQQFAQPIFRQLTLQDILREAIHAGLPSVVKRYAAASVAAKRADKNES